MAYIGETGRKLSTRLKEHGTLQRLKEDKSLFGKHTNDEQHTNDNITSNYKILKVEPNTQKRKLFTELKKILQQPHEHYKL